MPTYHQLNSEEILLVKSIRSLRSAVNLTLPRDFVVIMSFQSSDHLSVSSATFFTTIYLNL